MLSDSTRRAIFHTLMQGERNITGVNSRASRARDQIQAALGPWMNTYTHSGADQMSTEACKASQYLRELS